MTDDANPPSLPSRPKTKTWLFDVLLLLIILAGATFRSAGLFWGEYQYLHPDERFLIWVGTDISPVKIVETEAGPLKQWLSVKEYFDTPNSPLNPNNRGHGFYVYGTLPMLIARYAVELIFDRSGFDVMTQAGRVLSALSDLLTVLLVYLIGARIYGRRVGLLAAAFSSAAVLQIQQSHFFTMDTFSNFFAFTAVYFAVRIMTDRRPWPGEGGPVEPDSAELDIWGRFKHGLLSTIRHPLFWPGLLFGLFYGMAMASKLSIYPLAIMLPGAVALRISIMPRPAWQAAASRALVYLVLAGLASLVVFRLAQPYAFSGPGVLGLSPNPAWLAQIREQRNQATPAVDMPPAMQWARRPIWFSGQNLVVWGLGLPLGLLAAAGFLWAGWKMLQGDWRRHALLWGWTALYFSWQSLALNPTMRYQLPVYPTLVIFAAWALVDLWDSGQRAAAGAAAPPARRYSWQQLTALGLGGLTLLATFAYALGFSTIYLRPITRVEASRWLFQNVPGPINLHVETSAGSASQPLPFPYGGAIVPGVPYRVDFSARASGLLNEITLPHLRAAGVQAGQTELAATISAPDGQTLSRVTQRVDLNSDQGDQAVRLALDPPVAVEQDSGYQLNLELLGEPPITLAGAGLANEGEWDDGLPLRVDGYDGFGGIYPLDLNFNMYWDDTPEKLERFSRILDQSEYIVITSNRQWGSLPRIPERFPMTTQYYRSLLGCPPEKDIVWCYRVAQPGKFSGGLGFDLVKVFQSDPALGPLHLNDQFAEEAFTVYDHPKVLVFQKQAGYDPQQARSLLESVDFSKMLRLPPLQFASFPRDLTLPAERWLEQQAGGTWAKLFNSQAWQNQSQAAGVLLWYAALLLLGLIAYPIIRLALPGLADRGYPLARTAGLLLFSYLAWLAGSNRIPVTRTTLAILLALLALVSLLLLLWQRRALGQEWRKNKWYFLAVEGFFLLFFVVDLLIRYGNPDLWHPWKGGEKPMDFAYFNAVLKSTSFPPYDPWYAGGYLNYYYYGFVFAGMLAKLLGIVPAVAYNLILPSMFAMIAMGAFSLAWNIYCGANGKHPQAARDEKADLEQVPAPAAQAEEEPFQVSPYWAGLAGALGMAVLGNLGTVKMIYEGYQRLAAPGGIIEHANLFTRLLWAGQGFLKNIAGAPLAYGIGDWYWNPSRAIPSPGEVEPITEFPFFTVLYGDPHAHLFSLAIALLAVGFALSVVLGRARWKGMLAGLLWYLLGALAVGALKPTNTWDFYPYLALCLVALGYALARYAQPIKNPPTWLGFLARLPELSQRLVITAAGLAAFTGLSFILFRPFSQWYGLGYSKIDFWQGLRTPLPAYLWHWGLFLFVLVSWFAWETHEWLANTPLSSTKKVKPYQGLILGALIFLVVLAAALAFKLPAPGKLPFGNGVIVAWLVLPLAAWAGALILRPGQPDSKRFALFLAGTGLTLTLMVEVIVLVGDIGRMNTVFKFYLQVWTMFAVCAAAASGWLVSALPNWSARWRNGWSVVFILLVAGAILYPVTASRGKIEDRMMLDAPHTLDGMKYMETAQYDWEGLMDLSQDYRAIRWLQENVAGSPVIVEANLRDLYRWGSRYSIYTGLPGVVGWEWHQQQQRALNPGSWVSDRIAEIDSFYSTTDLQAAISFLKKYGVKYIIMGQLERNHYPGAGLEKFESQNGVLWQEVYRDGSTVIYEVPNQTTPASERLPGGAGES